MSADLEETMGELRDLLLDMQARAQDTGYGYFPGGDPRAFTPDHESCTAEEVQRWKDDCARAERGEPPNNWTPHCGGRAGYGVGTYTMLDEDLQSDCDRLGRAIAQLEALIAEGAP